MSPVNESYQTVRRIVLAGIGVSCGLAAVNIVVGLVTHSTAVAAIGFEFAGDVLASSIVLIAVRVAAIPPDENHPYGHGRFETLAAFAVGAILATAGAAICYQSLRAIGVRHGPPGRTSVYALAAAIALRGIMSVIKFRVGRRLRSAALTADAWNDTVDILSAAAALIAVVLASRDPDRYLAADHYGGVAVGIIVILTGVRVLRDASLDLADTMPPSELTEAARRVALSVSGVRGVEKLFARKTGLQYHIDLHVEVDPAMTVLASHEIAAKVRIALQRDLSWVADVLVHVEPASMP